MKKLSLVQQGWLSTEFHCRERSEARVDYGVPCESCPRLTNEVQ